MNEIEVEVLEILEFETLHIIKFNYAKRYTILAMTLELPDIKEGSRVIISFKPTHCIIQRNRLDNISIDNQIKVKLIEAKVGELLVYLKFKCENDNFEAIITKNSYDKLALKESDELFLGINASEIYIKEIL